MESSRLVKLVEFSGLVESSGLVECPGFVESSGLVEFPGLVESWWFLGSSRLLDVLPWV